jgi:hypothetical protein
MSYQLNIRGKDRMGAGGLEETGPKRILDEFSASRKFRRGAEEMLVLNKQHPKFMGGQTHKGGEALHPAPSFGMAYGPPKPWQEIPPKNRHFSPNYICYRTTPAPFYPDRSMYTHLEPLRHGPHAYDHVRVERATSEPIAAGMPSLGREDVGVRR